MSESAHHRWALMSHYLVDHCRTGTAPALFADATVLNAQRDTGMRLDDATSAAALAHSVGETWNW